MYVKKDVSYIRETGTKLMGKGYGKMTVHSIHFDRYYSEEQKMQNVQTAKSMSVEEWSNYCDKISESFEKPMTEILSKFIEKYDIHQVSEETRTMEHYRSDWDLFFHSNKGWNGKSHMDSFDLKFNGKRTPEQNMQLLDEIIEMVKTLEYDNIACRVQYDVAIDEDKLAEDGIHICEEVVGKMIYYCGHEGKIKEVSEYKGIKEYGFFKKNAKNKYYPVDYKELVVNYGMNEYGIEYPLYGIIYNCQGQKEENYLYSAEELSIFRPDLYVDVMSNGSAEDAFDASKTLICYSLLDEESVKDFLTGGKNSLPVSPESDDYKKIAADWYWESKLENDLFGKKSNTMKKVIELLEINNSLLCGAVSVEEDVQKYLYDIMLDEECICNSGDLKFSTKAEAQADADDYIISKLSKKYERPVSDFKVDIYIKMELPLNEMELCLAMKRLTDVLIEKDMPVMFKSDEALTVVAKRVLEIKDNNHVSEDDAIDTVLNDTEYIEKYLINNVECEYELNRRWIYDDANDDIIGETNFVVPAKWLKDLYEMFYRDEYGDFETFIELYEPEAEGEFIYQKAIKECVLKEDIGIVIYQ